MVSSQRRSALVQSVAQALSFAVSDPEGHNVWNLSQYGSPGKRRRGVEEMQNAATVFDSSVIPPIGIDKYLMRLSSTFRCNETSFVAALIVVDRLLQYDGGRLPLTMRNVHRLFFASLVVAVKYHEDLVYSNSHYAKAGGVHLKEVNRLERVLLLALDFDLGVDREQYEIYEAALLALSDGGAPPKKPTLEGAVALKKATVDNESGVSAALPVQTSSNVPLPHGGGVNDGMIEDCKKKSAKKKPTLQAAGGYPLVSRPQSYVAESNPLIKTGSKADGCDKLRMANLPLCLHAVAV